MVSSIAACPRSLLEERVVVKLESVSAVGCFDIDNTARTLLKNALNTLHSSSRHAAPVWRLYDHHALPCSGISNEVTAVGASQSVCR